VAANPPVYIVDDEQYAIRFHSFLLESKGYVVKSSSSALGFLAAATALPIECLIVDIRMPEMDGLELQDQLRTRMLGFPMVVITRHAVPLAVRAMKAGAVDFIEKPFASETILDSLGVALCRLASPNERDPAAAAAAEKLALLS
jgi:two-component system response regulator FixJ